MLVCYSPEHEHEECVMPLEHYSGFEKTLAQKSRVSHSVEQVGWVPPSGETAALVNPGPWCVSVRDTRDVPCA
jgi:hypothetical protein